MIDQEIAYPSKVVTQPLLNLFRTFLTHVLFLQQDLSSVDNVRAGILLRMDGGIHNAKFS
jgi:hypothetical protein